MHSSTRRVSMRVHKRPCLGAQQLPLQALQLANATHKALRKLQKLDVGEANGGRHSWSGRKAHSLSLQQISGVRGAAPARISFKHRKEPRRSALVDAGVEVEVLPRAVRVVLPLDALHARLVC